jgi:hypothetical protein
MIQAQRTVFKTNKELNQEELQEVDLIMELSFQIINRLINY